MKSPLKAIEEKCRDCNYDPLDNGTWRQQIESCTSEDCSLWHFRPITIAKKQENRQKVINAMSPEERLKIEEKSRTFRERMKLAEKSKTG